MQAVTIFVDFATGLEDKLLNFIRKVRSWRKQIDVHSYFVVFPNCKCKLGLS